MRFRERTIELKRAMNLRQSVPMRWISIEIIRNSDIYSLGCRVEDLDEKDYYLAIDQFDCQLTSADRIGNGQEKG